MSKNELTPQEIEYKRMISSTLVDLLNKSGKKQIDITKQMGIPASTLTGYFKGTRLPAPENVEKLAKFFNVDKSEIDPRFKTSTEDSSKSNHDLDEMLDNARSFDGKPMSPQDREIIRAYLKGMYSNK